MISGINHRLVGRMADFETEMRSVAISCIGTSPLIMSKMCEEAMSCKARSCRDRAAFRIYRNGEGKAAIPASMLFAALVGALARRNSLQACRSAAEVIPEFLSFEDEFAILSNGRDGQEPDWVCHAYRTRSKKSRFPLVYIPHPRFDKWEFVTNISYDHKVIQRENLIRLFQQAGRGQGIGLFRPTKKGPYGTFQIREWDEKTGLSSVQSAIALYKVD